MNLLSLSYCRYSLKVMQSNEKHYIMYLFVYFLSCIIVPRGDLVKPALEILEDGKLNGVSQACRKYGISRTLYYRWQQRYLSPTVVIQAA